jgi:hypothetical protein
MGVTHYEIARRLGYVSTDSFFAVSARTSALGRILNGLREWQLTTGNWKPETAQKDKGAEAACGRFGSP